MGVPKNRIFIIDERSRMSIRETREIFDSYSELTQYLPDYFPPAQGVVQKEAEEGRVYDDDDEDANDTQVATALLVQKYLLHGTKGQILTHEDANSTQSSGTQYIARRFILVQKYLRTGTQVQILTNGSAAPPTRVPCPQREGGWTRTSPISTSSCLLSRWPF